MRGANLIQPEAKKDWARGGCSGAKSRRPDEFKAVKTLLVDGLRDVGDKPRFSGHYGRAKNTAKRKKVNKMNT